MRNVPNEGLERIGARGISSGGELGSAALGAGIVTSSEVLVETTEGLGVVVRFNCSEGVELVGGEAVELAAEGDEGLAEVWFDKFG